MVSTRNPSPSAPFSSTPPVFCFDYGDVKSHDTENNHTSDDHNDDSIKSVCEHYAHHINTFLDSNFSSPVLKKLQAQTRIALGVIQTALERYSLEEISLSYNGGKDCLVLLILFLCAIAMSPVRNYTSTTNLHLPRRIKSVYITAQHPFSEVDAFVEKCESTYRLDLVRYAMPMKAAFTRYLDEHKTIKAILVGTRRTDPHGKLLTHFDETDGGWPRFMRIHPIIDWKYTEIWAFIRHLEIPYCTLYDKGFTSLGGITDTHPNPVLKIDGTINTYKPAYELVEDEAERLGRDCCR